MAGNFVHLHAHSEYSILDSSCTVSSLVNRAAELDMSALALTDHGMMGGAIKFYREAVKQEIKPIIGCEVYVAPGDCRERRVRDGIKYYHLVLLAKNKKGYENLLRLVTLAHTEGFYYKPRVDRELLRQFHSGLIALSACESGEIPKRLLAGSEELAYEAAKEYAEIFGEGNFYIELQNHGTDRDAKLRKTLVELASSINLPLVATNDIHYLTEDDHLAHEVVLNIRSNKKLDDPNRLTFDGEGFHFRTEEEMVELFKDIPEAIRNTQEIADRCNLELELGQTRIPPFSLPEGMPDSKKYLRKLAYEGAEDRFEKTTDEIRERLGYELSVIERMDYDTYFLIVWDFVRFAHEQEIPVGPGRGSAAGSLVAYCLGITDVDPLKYDLIFERFLNPDRVSMPDFDIDFCIEGREKVINYVQQKYGAEKMAQIATYDRMAARSAVRDVGRVLGVSYGETDRLAKLIPFGYKLQQAVDSVGELKALYESDEDVQKIVDIAVLLEGQVRNASTHAAGVVIAADELTRSVPLMRLADEAIVTQFDMLDVERAGLLKFDFLGLRNLTLIDSTRTTLRNELDVSVDLDDIPLDDEKTFGLLQQCRTAGIFQLESSGMRALIKRVHPTRFEDLIALLALYRPGPLESGMTDDYVERRKGRQKITYPHPSLEDVLEETYGLPIYQDQVMFMAQKMAGFSLSEADILRKAMGKKQEKIMAGLREKFLSGCSDNEISREQAESTFADMEKFARYGFNKSHTTSYAFVSYWTAYLKANYPSQFMASLLTSIQGNLDKVAEYIGECNEMGIEVLPPDINESDCDFAAVSDSEIRFGLGAIKHVGRTAIEEIISSRDGGFDSFFAMCRAIDGNGLDREALEALIKTGAFDSFGNTRKGLLSRLSEGLEMMQVARHERRSGQVSFFDDEVDTQLVEPEMIDDEFSQEELLAFEKELLGLYVSAHPLDRHEDTMCVYYTALSELDSVDIGDQVTVGGRIKKIRKIQTKRGGQMAFVTLEDRTTEKEVTVFSEVLESAARLFVEDQLVGITIAVSERNGEPNFIAQQAFSLQDVVNKQRVVVVVDLDNTNVNSDCLSEISQILTSHPGDSSVVFRVTEKIGAADVVAGEDYQVDPGNGLKAELEKIVGEGGVRFENGRH